MISMVRLATKRKEIIPKLGIESLGRVKSSSNSLEQFVINDMELWGDKTCGSVQDPVHGRGMTGSMAEINTTTGTLGPLR